MIEKRAITSVPVIDPLGLRWSGRAYDSSRPVAPEHLLALLEAARWAPSCFGDQPWRYIVCDRNADAAAWQSAFDCLAPGNQAWAIDAPVLMLSLADSLFAHNGKPNRWAQYDTGAASMSLCVQATALGLMVHQMGGFDPDRARSTFGVPDQYVPMSMMTIGHQLAERDLPAESRERELAPRDRRALGQTFFTGRWGRAFSG
jgi:nitroreductase